MMNDVCFPTGFYPSKVSITVDTFKEFSSSPSMFNKTKSFFNSLTS